MHPLTTPLLSLGAQLVAGPPRGRADLPSSRDPLELGRQLGRRAPSSTALTSQNVNDLLRRLTLRLCVTCSGPAYRATTWIETGFLVCTTCSGPHSAKPRAAREKHGRAREAPQGR